MTPVRLKPRGVFAACSYGCKKFSRARPNGVPRTYAKKNCGCKRVLFWIAFLGSSTLSLKFEFQKDGSFVVASQSNPNLNVKVISPAGLLP
eukprot:457373-Pyramimonas_sp.AAC.1